MKKLSFGIVNLNLTIDRTYFVNNFVPGQVFRPVRTFWAGGGKGINVARVMRTLGVKIEVLGFLAGKTGQIIKNNLREEGLSLRPVWVKGESRNCMVVVDLVKRTQTVINEPGPLVSLAEAERIKKVFRRFLKNKTAIILTGSIPHGLPVDIYRQLIEISKRERIPVILDTSGEPLKKGLEGNPFLIKPNLLEFECLLKIRLNSLKIIKNKIRETAEQKNTNIIVSLGKEGVLAWLGDGLWQVVPPSVKVVNAVGSGDSLVAGFCSSFFRDRDIIKALGWGVASGTANALTERTGFCLYEDIARIYKKIKIKRLN